MFLRHQLDIALRRAPPRLRLRGIDRVLLIWMTRLWPDLLGVAKVVQPETILRWHRAGFKMFWRWKSRNRAGRPKIDRGLRDLIKQIQLKNPNRPRVISQELFQVCDGRASKVAPYISRRQLDYCGQSSASM